MVPPQQQLDLFDVKRVEPQSLLAKGPAEVDVGALSDAGLIAGLREANIGASLALAEEIARRQLFAAIPALEALCLRHVGFGMRRAIPEQAAAVEALARIGGEEAARAVARLIARRAMEGPGLALILKVAGELRAVLSDDILAGYLRHDDDVVRAAAARCTGLRPRSAENLIELLNDLHANVRIAAACALGRMGRVEGRAILLQAGRADPTEEVVRALAGIGDEDCIVLLARTASARPDLAPVILDELEGIDDPRAEKAAVALRTRMGSTYS